MNVMDWFMGEYRRTGEKPPTVEIAAAMRAEHEANRGRTIYKMTQALLAGDPNWADPVMQIEVGEAQRMMNASIAKAIQARGQVTDKTEQFEPGAYWIRSSGFGTHDWVLCWAVLDSLYGLAIYAAESDSPYSISDLRPMEIRRIGTPND